MGSLACTDPLSIGLFGRYTRYANEVIDEADLVPAVGCKLGEIATRRYTLPRKDIPLIQLDCVAEEIGRWTTVDVALHGDAREGLRDLVAAVKTGEITAKDGYGAGLLYDTKRAGRGFVADRGFASIGYGLPGAIGARFARQDVPVVAITGDGGFNMAAGDLETAVREGLAFTLVVVDNAASGYVKALRHAVYGPGRYESSDLAEVDYAAVAKAYGCAGVRVTDPDQLGPALSRAIVHTGGPVVVDVVVTRDPARMLPGADSRT
jgi:acetolactate synthase-1/2/3 large subunit